MKVNLYVLGACFIKLFKRLYLNEEVKELQGFPLVDPSLFIDRFCKKLEFGEK